MCRQQSPRRAPACLLSSLKIRANWNLTLSTWVCRSQWQDRGSRSLSPAVASLEAGFCTSDCPCWLFIRAHDWRWYEQLLHAKKHATEILKAIHQDWTGSTVGSSATSTPEYMHMLMVAGCFQLLARLALTAVSMVYVVCVQRSRWALRSCSKLRFFWTLSALCARPADVLRKATDKHLEFADLYWISLVTVGLGEWH